MACCMDGLPLVHPTQGGNLFQEFVHLLIRRNRETGTFRIFWVPVLVFLQNDKSRFQKRYIASTAFLMSGYLHAALVYPQFPLIIFIKMCRAQGLHINVRQAGQTTEQEKTFTVFRRVVEKSFSIISFNSSRVRNVGHVSSLRNRHLRFPANGSSSSHPFSLASPRNLRKQLIYLVRIFWESLRTVLICISNRSINSPLSS